MVPESFINLLPPDLARPKVSSPSASNATQGPVPASAVPRFGPPAHLIPDNFWSNFRDFLLERPAKLGPPRAGTPFRQMSFGDGVFDNLKDFFSSRPAPPRTAGTSRLEVNWG